MRITIDTDQIKDKALELSLNGKNKSLDLSITALKHTKKAINKLQRLLKDAK